MKMMHHNSQMTPPGPLRNILYARYKNTNVSHTYFPTPRHPNPPIILPINPH